VMLTMRTMTFDGFRLRAAVWLLLAMLCTPLALGQEPPGGRPPTPVRAAPVVLREVQEQRQITGNLRALARSRVATIEGGLVVECPIEEGDLVKKGDLLARLDDRRLALELLRIEAQSEVAQATLVERNAQVNRSERDFRLLQEVSERNAGNPKELADAESDLQVALARQLQAERDLTVLKAQADLFRTRLDDMVITAPFDGVIVVKETEVGQWLGVGDPLVEIVSVGEFDAWLDVPQSFAEAVRGPEVKVPIQVRASQLQYPPAKPRIIRQVDPISRTFYLVVRVKDDNDHLAPGMSVTGWVPTGQKAAHLLLPRDALMRNQAGFYVYAVSQSPGGPAQAVPRQVDMLFEYEGFVAIRPGGLQEGDMVVTEGNERLFPMSPVAIVEDTGPGAANRGTPADGSKPGSTATAGREESD
jgi:RND family efflux transporter MFP subunit